jgi:DNA-directed RNA polymerase subunit RPC12/RpoP
MVSKKGNITTCPYCSSTMKKTEAPFKYHGSYIGKFDAYVCTNCKRVYFTEKAYKDIMQLPLNPDEQSNYSETVNMPSVTAISAPIVITRKENEVTSSPNPSQIEVITTGTETQNKRKLNGDMENEYTTTYT